jgi:hypothetical protein
MTLVGRVSSFDKHGGAPVLGNDRRQIMTIHRHLAAVVVVLAIASVATPGLAQSADEPISGARAQALRECNDMAKGYQQSTWATHQLTLYRTCMNQHGMQQE